MDYGNWFRTIVKAGLKMLWDLTRALRKSRGRLKADKVDLDSPKLCGLYKSIKRKAEVVQENVSPAWNAPRMLLPSLCCQVRFLKVLPRTLGKRVQI